MCIRDSFHVHEADGAVEVEVYFQLVHQVEHGHVVLAEVELSLIHI